ncbi:MAG: hypothetical protein NXH75_11450 [Halobacteriovoraceae bacterium]|nr:hypothetical protein [Halobacteriovoraceae bacterium]
MILKVFLIFLLSSCAFRGPTLSGSRSISSVEGRFCRDTLKALVLPDIPPPSKELFSSSIFHPKLYLWDNWGFKENGITHVYSLAASRRHSSRDRHFHVHWRHFVSGDNGKTWRDLGSVLEPQKGKDSFDSQSIWSGSVTKLRSGKYVAAYTGLDPKREFLQSISFAISDDGHNFKRAYGGKTPALSHTLHRQRFIKAGYYVDSIDNLGKRTGEENNSIQALRDPFLFEERDGTVHIFWAAKTYDQEGKVISAIGHGKVHGFENPDSLEILPPLRPTDGEKFSQLELPNVYQRSDGRFQWIIGTTNRQTEAQAEHETEMAVRTYISDSLDSDLKPLQDDSVLFYANDEKVYGANLIQDFSKGVDEKNPVTRVFSVDESSSSNFSLPANLQLEIQ